MDALVRRIHAESRLWCLGRVRREEGDRPRHDRCASGPPIWTDFMIRCDARKAGGGLPRPRGDRGKAGVRGKRHARHGRLPEHDDGDVPPGSRAHRGVLDTSGKALAARSGDRTDGTAREPGTDGPGREGTHPQLSRPRTENERGRTSRPRSHSMIPEVLLDAFEQRRTARRRLVREREALHGPSTRAPGRARRGVQLGDRLTFSSRVPRAGEGPRGRRADRSRPPSLDAAADPRPSVRRARSGRNPPRRRRVPQNQSRPRAPDGARRSRRLRVAALGLDHLRGNNFPRRAVVERPRRVRAARGIVGTAPARAAA